MKKLFYLLLFLPLVLLSSCSDDNDLAQVDLSMTLSGVTMVDNTLYTVAGEIVSVDNVEVKSLTSEPAIIQRVEYSLDGLYLRNDFANPLGVTFSTEGFKIGKHFIGMSGLVLQVDKTITNIAARVPLVVVENISDLPQGAPEIGTYTVNL
ncbi:MAG: hypothetical protein K2G69_00310 [Muribaculaceae bacterium]|nr:hypothetical protein [Muribaculaceae bacterium]